MAVRVIYKWMIRLLWILVIFAVSVFGIRVFETQRGPQLQLWHTFVPDDMQADAIDKASWEDYIRAENVLFQSVRENVTDKLPPEVQTQLNRYYSGSPIYPDRFVTNWNRSYIMMPDGPP